MTAHPVPPSAGIDLLPGARALAELHAAELPQKDDLCGAFCATLALRACSVRVPGGGEVQQDDVAVRAGATVFAGDHAASLPPGEQGRSDYLFEIPRVDDQSVSGTSAFGLARAIEIIGERRVAVIPAAGEWTAGAAAALLRVARSLERPCAPIANLATRFLWNSHAPLLLLLQYLDDGDAENGPPAEWSVGHFVLLIGTIEGRRGTLVFVADTYRSLGSAGIHLQPIERVALALLRPSLSAGGVLVVTDPSERAVVESALADAGLSSRLWDNGSVDAVAGGQ